MMSDGFASTRPACWRRGVVEGCSVILRSVRCRLGRRGDLCHLFELDDYLLEDMGLSRDWFIAERRRRGILPGFMDMGGRRLVRSGIRHARGMRDGFW